MEIMQSTLFQNFPELVFGFSTKIGLNRKEPFFFNLSFNVGDKYENILKNRESFFNSIGLKPGQIAYQKQIHSDIIKFVEKPGLVGESDSLITKYPNIGLAISTADCTPIFIYDKENKVIAAVHSGWRGTQKRILKKTLNNLSHHFSSKTQNMFVYIGPSISQRNYEIGKEVAVLFDQKYLKFIHGKIHLDVVGSNLDMLLEFGIPEEQIEVSNLCTYENSEMLHSYRRDGKLSGRSLGIIALKDLNGK